jgi:hypothetical protein
MVDGGLGCVAIVVGVELVAMIGVVEIATVVEEG